ncbi:MAG: TraB/GumN family protein [Pseudomonadota bacterium]
MKGLTLATLLGWLLTGLSAPLAEADGHALPLWQIDGDSNRVYLLGSVHLLREEDYPLPSRIDAVYDDAEKIIMELDLDDLDEARAQALVTELGSIANGASLADLLGEDAFSQASALAAEINIPLQMLATVEPWLAAITIEQLMLQRIGFNPAYGIESYFVSKATGDGKDIAGLEDIADQLGLLDALSAEAQSSLLLQTLSEAGDIAATMDSLIQAWRRGDVSYLEANILADMQAFPELYEAIVVGRNRNWVDSIEALLDDEDDYLIVVGALHLVGEDSVPAMLSERGRSPVQLRQSVP